MSGLRITLDDRDLQRWGTTALKLVENNVRSAIDRAARKARAEAIEEMARDSLVPKARFRAAVPPVKTTRPGSLVATWAVGKSKNSIRRPGGGTINSIPRGTAVAASSYAVSGGGSARMTLRRAFVINANGGRVVMTRLGPGILQAPGQPYAGPTPGVSPPVNPTGISKRLPYATAAQLATYPVAAPTSPGKVIQLPSAPTELGSLSVAVNERTYLGPAIVNVNGQAVTLSFVLFPTDTIFATYR